MPRPPLSLRDMTASEIRDALPDPASLDVRPIPGTARRELFRALQQHNPADFAELRSATNTTAGNIVRDQYFQFAHVLNFPIRDWLDREQAVHDRARIEAQRGNAAASRQTKGKLALAVELLENLGYAWHGASNKFVKVPDAWE